MTNSVGLWIINLSKPQFLRFPGYHDIVSFARPLHQKWKLLADMDYYVLTSPSPDDMLPNHCCMCWIYESHQQSQREAYPALSDHVMPTKRIIVRRRWYPSPRHTGLVETLEGRAGSGTMETRALGTTSASLPGQPLTGVPRSLLASLSFS